MSCSPTKTIFGIWDGIVNAQSSSLQAPPKFKSSDHVAVSGSDTVDEDDFSLDDIAAVAHRIQKSILVDRAVKPSLHRMSELSRLPSRAKIENILLMMRKIIFPGMFEEFRITEKNVAFHLGTLLGEVKELLEDQIYHALLFDCKRTHPLLGTPCSAVVSPLELPQSTTTTASTTLTSLARGRSSSFCSEDATAQAVAQRVECEFENRKSAAQKTREFLQTVPSLRSKLLLDVESSMRGDPAAKSPEEIMLCYPGIEAIFVHRIAHELFIRHVPLIPRMMSGYAHQRTAIDIHPGALIGESFFIDHGTGVVIGETTIIGNNVKLFHGVTLGALSTKEGQALAGKKRHPTIEDDVTIYAGAVILGGTTVVGKGATIGGSVFLTRSVPANVVVSAIQPEHRVRGLRRPSATNTFSDFDPCI